MEREAGQQAVGPADALPVAVDADLAADGAGGVFDDRQAARPSDGQDGGQIAGEADLVHAQNGARARGDGACERRRIHVVGVGLDIDEDGSRTTATTALAVAMKLWLTVATSSPGRTPATRRQSSSATVQLDTATAQGAPTAAANSRSKAATSGPWATQPERMTRAAASISASPSASRTMGICMAPGSGLEQLGRKWVVRSRQKRRALRWPWKAAGRRQMLFSQPCSISSLARCLRPEGCEALVSSPTPSRKTTGLKQVFRALDNRNYRLFFFGQGVSLIGTWMQTIALGWLVYRITHSPFLLGMVGFAGQLPMLVLTPLAGVLSDRWQRRRVLVMTQSLAMFQALALACLTLTGLVQVWHIMVLAVFSGAVNSFDMPTRQAFTLEMVDRKEDLPNAIALNSSVFNVSRLIGPTIAGVLISLVGEGMCFLLNGISYIAVIGALLSMRLVPRRRRPRRGSVERPAGRRALRFWLLAYP